MPWIGADVAVHGEQTTGLSCCGEVGLCQPGEDLIAPSEGRELLYAPVTGPRSLVHPLCEL